MSPHPPPVTALWLVSMQTLLLLSRGLRRVFGCQGASVLLGGWLVVVDQLADGLVYQVIDRHAQGAGD